MILISIHLTYQAYYVIKVTDIDIEVLGDKFSYTPNPRRPNFSGGDMLQALPPDASGHSIILRFFLSHFAPASALLPAYFQRVCRPS